MTDAPDPLAILSALGEPAPDQLTPVSGGWDTALWRVDSRGRSFALRVFREDQIQTCQREALVMRTVREAGLPAPGVCAQGIGEGRPALLLEWCRGRTLLQEVRARPWRAWPLGRAMGVVHARLHAVGVPEQITAELPAWTPRTDDVAPDLHAYLTSASDTSAPLLHLDYHPLNVMSDGRTVTGVLDWANVAVGDRRADLARTVTLWRLPPAPPGTPALLLQGMRAILEAAWRSGYREHQPVDPFANLEPFYAWAGGMMERDLRPKLGRPGVWLQERDLSRIHQWTIARQKRFTRT